MKETDISQDADIKRLAWRCRRGTKELDLMLEKFVANEYQKLSSENRQRFYQLLEVEDPILTAWLCNRVKPEDQGMEQIVTKILSANII